MITSKKTESVIKNVSTNKSLGGDNFTGEFYQTFAQELIPTLLKLFQKKTKKKRELSQIFLAKITLIPKPDEGTIRRENYRPVSLMKKS